MSTDLGEAVEAVQTRPETGENGVSVAALKESILDHLNHALAHGPETATERDWWIATCLAVRDTAMERFGHTQAAYRRNNVRRVFYLSVEYLIGRLLENNLLNTGLYDSAREALAELGKDIDKIKTEEPDMGLGNGGLGRLAACFLDSLATLEYPAVGYGIRYEFGLFRQDFADNRQVEHPDIWMRYGNPWQIVRPEYIVEVELYGRSEQHFNDVGEARDVWVDTKTIVGVPWDVPIVGYGCETVNFLRLWESCASEEFNFSVFNEGGYDEAVREKVEGETISKVLYPNDSTASGKELRLVQQYFFVACSIADIMRRHRRSNSIESLAEKNAIQLNDTHPTLAILELMRVFVDEEGVPWDRAWDICRETFSYTNHTLLPEAIERWSVSLFEKVLPRHLQIAVRINRKFLQDEVEKKWPGDDSKKRELSIFEEGQPEMIRMGNLAVIGSHSTNGVAALHTRLLKENLFKGFNELYPERFNNKTNGITPRRWLAACNPELADLITEKLGKGWQRDLDRLHGLEAFADEQEFQDRYADRSLSTTCPPLRVTVERERAGFSAWYEFFPRSAEGLPDRSSTFRDCLPRLDDARAMGFDVIYFPPIHPIGVTARKGPNNSVTSSPGDPGSPWAIGSPEGGHKSVEPSLGTIEDFEWLVAEAKKRDLEIALDFAINSSPDHPWVRDHPEWFFHRPDGSIKYAENPPKKYQDIYPLNFHCDDWKNLWREMLDTVLFWAEKGVRIFRVDNPHTKPFAFWEYLIEEVRARFPDTIFLAEAFTRPKMMQTLGKIGFSQSYTYFTWRRSKQDFIEYLTELTRTDMADYYRANFWPNTPDILSEPLRNAGPQVFRLRAVLAALLCPNWGIYSGYEFCENQPASDQNEEYLESEKFQFKARDWDNPDNIVDTLTALNHIRRDNPALRLYTNITFCHTGSEHILAWVKATPAFDNIVLTVVNLDPDHAHDSDLHLPLDELRLPDNAPLRLVDLLNGGRYEWLGRNQYVHLDPADKVAHVFKVET